MSGEIFSNASDLANPLRWIGIASAVVDKIDYASFRWCSQSRISSKSDSCRRFSCGSVQRNLSKHQRIIGEANRFSPPGMERKGFNNIAQFKGRLNIKDVKGVNTFERTQFLKYFGKKE